MSSSLSPDSERSQLQRAGIIDPDEWPLESFPRPPLDGRWIPKLATPPSRSPPPLPNVPLNLTLDPPIMAITYPPPSPLSLEDPAWLNQMLADIVRQRSRLEAYLAEVQADVGNAYIEAGLADTELEEEMAKMQAFLNVVARVAGSGFVRRMLEDVEHSVEVISMPPGNDGDASASSSSSRSTSSPPHTRSDTDTRTILGLVSLAGISAIPTQPQQSDRCLRTPALY